MKRWKSVLVTSLLLFSCSGPATFDDSALDQPITSTTSRTPSTASVTTTSTTTSTSSTTSTLPPTPELVAISSDAAPWSVATLSFDRDGLPVMVYATETWKGDLIDLAVVVTSCGDQHCAAGPQHRTVWELPGSELFSSMWGNFRAAIGSDGSVIGTFDMFVFEHADPPESELEAMSQYVLTCGDATCEDRSLETVGPVEDDTHPIGGFQLDSHSLMVSAAGQATLVYAISSPRPDAWLDFHFHSCPPEASCVPDVGLDPLLYSLPSSGDVGTGISGDIVLRPSGAPTFAIGIDLPGMPWRISLATCDDPDCAQPSVRWLDVPTAGKAIRDVDLELGGDGNPILAYTDHVGDQLNLHLVICDEPDCSSFSTISVADKVRRDWDLTTDGMGTPYLVWGDVDADEAVIATCSDHECTSLTSVRPGLSGTEDWVPCLAIAPDGYPMVTFHQPDRGLQLFNCLPEQCSDIASRATR